MAATQTATKTGNGATVKQRKARGSGPMQLAFVDSQGNESKRVSEKTTGLKVSVADKSEIFGLDKYSPHTVNAMAFFALASRGKTAVANGSKKDGSNIFDLFHKMDSDLVVGKFYPKGEGKPRGKARIDLDVAVRAYKEANAYQAKRKVMRTNKKGELVAVQALTDKQYNDLVAWMESVPYTQAKERHDSWAKSDTYRKMFKTLEAQKMTIGDDVVPMEELPF